MLTWKEHVRGPMHYCKLMMLTAWLIDWCDWWTAVFVRKRLSQLCGGNPRHYCAAASAWLGRFVIFAWRERFSQLCDWNTYNICIIDTFLEYLLRKYKWSCHIRFGLRVTAVRFELLTQLYGLNLNNSCTVWTFYNSCTAWTSITAVRLKFCNSCTVWIFIKAVQFAPITAIHFELL